MKRPSITLAVPTYNREYYIKKMSASLVASLSPEALGELNVRVYDDRSPELSRAKLEAYFPFAKEICIRERNLRADLNMWMMYEDFLRTDDDVFVSADSDLIFRPGWLELACRLLPETDGVLSLYNSASHPFLQARGEGAWSAKEHLGAAGTVFTRERVEEIVAEFSSEADKSSMDWKWSKLFKDKGIRLACLYDSYIQHIGILGQNNRGFICDFDYGLGFLPESEVNQRIMQEFIEEAFQEEKRFITERRGLVLDALGCTEREVAIGRAVLMLPRWIQQKFFPKRW